MLQKELLKEILHANIIYPSQEFSLSSKPSDESNIPVCPSSTESSKCITVKKFPPWEWFKFSKIPSSYGPVFPVTQSWTGYKFNKLWLNSQSDV